MMPELIHYLSQYMPKMVRIAIKWRLVYYFPEFSRRGIHLNALGAKWKVYPKDNFTEHGLYLNHAANEAISINEIASRALGNRVLFYDVGANCGIYSIIMSKCIAASGSRIIAFEPNPIMHSRLQENVRLNSLQNRIQLEETALSDQNGVAILDLPDNLGEAGLGNSSNGIQVKTRKLSEYSFDNEDFDLRILKIDVEGHEYQILSSFFDDVSAEYFPDIILIETEHADKWTYDLLDRLKTIGYSHIMTMEGNTLLELKGIN